MKSGNYLVSVMAVAEARRRGAYEAMLTDGVGRIVEGGSSNFFYLTSASQVLSTFSTIGTKLSKLRISK